MSETMQQNENPEMQEEVTNSSPVQSPSLIVNEKLGGNIGNAPRVQDQEVTFYFKAPRKVDGKVPEDPDTGQPMKARPPLKLTLPMPTWEAIVDMLMGDNETHKKFIVSTFGDLIKDKVRQQVNDDNSPVKRQEDLRLDGLTLIALAEEEPTERAGRGIPKETWAAFEEDYINVMIPLTGRSEDKIKGAAKFLSGRLYQVKTNKKIVEFLAGQLDEWYQATPSREEFSDLYTYLVKKADDYKNMGEEALLESLMG
jgi:hypothetical protein